MKDAVAALAFLALLVVSSANLISAPFSFTDDFSAEMIKLPSPGLGVEIAGWSIEQGNIGKSDNCFDPGCVKLSYWNADTTELHTVKEFAVDSGEKCVLSADLIADNRASNKGVPTYELFFSFGTEKWRAEVTKQPQINKKDLEDYKRFTFRFTTSQAQSGKLQILHHAFNTGNGYAASVDNVLFTCGDGCDAGFGFDVSSGVCVKCTRGLFSAGGWNACEACNDPATSGSWEWGGSDANTNIDSCEFHPTTRAGCITSDNRVCEWIYFEDAKDKAAAGTACGNAGGALADVRDDEAAAFDAFLTANSITGSVWTGAACGAACSEARGYVCERNLDISFSDDFSTDTVLQSYQRIPSWAALLSPTSPKHTEMNLKMLGQWTVTVGNLDIQDNHKSTDGNYVDLKGYRGDSDETRMETKKFELEDGQPCSLSVQLRPQPTSNSVTFELAGWSTTVDLPQITNFNQGAWVDNLWAFDVSGAATGWAQLSVSHTTTSNDAGVLMDNVALSCPASCAPGFGLDSGACAKCAGGVYSEGNWEDCQGCVEPSVDAGSWEWGSAAANSDGEACEWYCVQGKYYDSAAENCVECAGTCGAGENETVPCSHGSDRECGVCGAGFLCVDGVPFACTAPEGAYCPAGYDPSSLRRSGPSAAALSGLPCPEGHYCDGGAAAPVPCTADEGFYCPAAFAPGAATVAEGLAGKACPPNMVCRGTVLQPEEKPRVCDLVQACGDFANATCGARQSTFYKLDDPPASYATDASASTCMKTADAASDANAQWVRVDLGGEQLVQTVRFVAAGAASDFTVSVAVADADPQSSANPSTGSALPEGMEECAVSAAGAGVWEAACAAAVKGQFVFVARSAARSALEVCDVEVFAHRCLAAAEGAETDCPIGFEPSPCSAPDHFCPGCTPCPAGTYSDKEGSYACTPCPGTTAYNERPYSPEGSTSEFQCEGDAFLDGTSTLAVEQVFFDQGVDAWIVDVAVEQAPKIQVNGLSALFLSSGGDEVVAGTYAASQFPCRADESRAAGSDLSAALSETLCCLQDMREGYLMTKVFRDFTDGLDLVAANDRCDAEDGSELLVNADLEVWGEGSVFVDVDGNSFANAITIEPIEAPAARRANPEGYAQTQYARITIPDAELYKISRHSPTLAPLPVDDTTFLKDQREIFIGLLDMLPTGTRVVDSASQQISIKLTRTQYGSFAAYGEQNIDYDFISYLNARAHQVVSTTASARRAVLPDQFYLEITYVYDDRLTATDEALPVEALATVEVAVGGSSSTPCTGSSLPADFATVVGQACGPAELGFGDGNQCPQVSIPEDHFGRLYIPLDGVPGADVVSVSFKLNLTDSNGKAAELLVSMDVVVSDFVSWCATDSGSIDLAERVIPAITIGTESDNPPRLYNPETPDFSAGVETLQDGLITLELSLNETNDLDDNLEVFFEDVLVIQINPGSSTTAADIRNPANGFIPTYTYDPDSRDATLNIRDALKAACSNMSFSESFFGCVYKHVLADEEITNSEWAYLVGSGNAARRTGHEAPTTAQDFMETMLGDGTAAVAARELGRDYEAKLLEDGFDTRKKIGIWINPGHVWGQTVHNSAYSLSKEVVIYVLFGVKSGVDGTRRRMLLQAGGDGRASILQTVTYEVTAASLVESVLEEALAVEVTAVMAFDAADACKPLAELLSICSAKLRAAVVPHASEVKAVECVAVEVKNADCGARRAAASPTAAVEAVIALAVSADARLDMDAVVASGAVLSMEASGGDRSFVTGGSEGDALGNDEEEEARSGSGSSSSGMVIGAAAGAAAAVAVLGLLGWRLSRRSRSPSEEALPEVMAAGLVDTRGESADKDRVESILFCQDKA